MRLFPTAQRLKIGRRNFRLLLDIKSKESTLQLVYDVLRRCPFFKAFLVTADVPEIYMQEFWATGTIHYHSIRFKMDNKKHIIDLESLMDILQICPKVHGQPFAEPPFEEEILAFIRFLGHSATIRTLTDVNINKLYQPWRCFAALINKCLTGKSSGYDSLRLSQAQILKSKAYKEYYAITTGEAAPKPKANVRRTRSSSNTSITPPTATTSPRLTASVKGKQTAKASKAKSLSALSEDDDGDEEDEGDDGEEGNADDDDEDDDGEEGNDDDVDQEVVRDDDKDDDEEGWDDEHESDEETREEESFNPIPQTPKSSEDEGDWEKDQGFNIGEEERHIEEEEEDELYRDININHRRGLQASLEVEDSHVTLNPVHPDGQQESSLVSSQFTPTSVAPLPITTPTMKSSTIATTTTSQAPIFPTTVPSDIIQNLPSFGSLFCFDDRLRSLEENFSKVMQTNQFTGAVSAIPEIVQHYMDQRMNKAVKVAVQIQSDRLHDETQRENDEFLRTVDENIKKIIKEQVKEQVKAQVSKILPKIEQAMNEQLEAEVLTRSSHSSRTSYVVAVDLSEMELKKILIEKIEGNKSIQRSDEQRNIYKALVDAYESDKIILDTYGETVILKRRHDNDEDKDEEPSAGLDRGSKRHREGKEPESASAPSETATRSAGRSTVGSRYRQASASESALAEEPVQTTSPMEEPSQPEFDTDFSNFLMNRLRVDTLTLELLAGPTYELMKGSCKSLIKLEYHMEEVYKAITDQLDWVNPEGQQYPHNLLQPLPLIPNNRGRRVIPFEHFINNDLEYLRGGASSRKYTTSITKTKATDYRHIKWIENLFYGFAVNRESARDVYSKRRIIAVTELKIVEWHSHKHLDWITARRDDDKLYKFKECDFKRLRIQDIEDMLLLLVQGKLTNMTVEERFAFNKKLNLTKPDSYRSDLKRKEAYTAYSNPRGFIYQNKDKKNRLMWIDELHGELHKFSDGTLTDVRTALDDRLKGIRMRYLPQTIWRKSDKDRAAAMIQAIDKRLKTRRIMRSLERFVGGRLHAAIVLAVQDEFPLSYHAVCCRHLMMNLSLKRDKTKALFWRICKAYTTEEFSRSMSHLQDIQTDAYDKLCQVGLQRWSRAHCPLMRYNYLTSNSVESVNTCTVVYRKLPVLKLAETYRAMVQEWYYQRRKLT
nr:transposase, MuDR, MULE transposase domain protein [Tanacetum cinerariifolium]